MKNIYNTTPEKTKEIIEYALSKISNQECDTSFICLIVKKKFDINENLIWRFLFNWKIYLKFKSQYDLSNNVGEPLFLWNSERRKFLKQLLKNL